LRMERLFRSFFMGGFECSTHRLLAGERLDLIASTAHDRHAALDYERLHNIGIKTARDGIRWHLIEKRPYEYDFSPVIPMVRAARATNTQVIWDVCHYGWPDDLDIFRPEFVKRFAALTRNFARVLREEGDEAPFLAPINEISFVAWGGGEEGYLNPFEHGRGNELKRQLVRASIEAIESIWDVCPDARIASIDPLIHVVANPNASRAEQQAVDAHNRSQFDAWDMIAGRVCPQLGGAEKYLDVIGVNYYVHNQWLYKGLPLPRTDPRYKPFRRLLKEMCDRYRRPLFIAETGIEDDLRPEWLAYICDETVAALRAGVQVEGLCLYPIVNHPGWNDARHCHNGLWDYCDDNGHREVYTPLVNEIKRQAVRISNVLERTAPERAGVCV
jgi:beta-glucosidase/6-phospho-beta-glucosidase/beta-galactosidase